MASLSVETKKLYKQIRMDVVSAYYRLSILLKLRESQENKDILWKAAPTFFDRVLGNDMMDAMVLNLARLLDPAKAGTHVNASLEKLINELEQLEPTLARVLRVHRDNLIRDLGDLEIWRNKWACHRDYNVMLAMQTPSPSALRPHLTIAQIQSALAELDAFLNAFQSIFEDKEVINPKNWEDTIMIEPPDPYSNFDASDEIERFLRIVKVGIQTLSNS